MSYKFKKTGEVVDTYRRGTEVRHDLRANIADLLFGPGDDE